VLEWDKTGFRRSQERKRKRSPENVRRKKKHEPEKKPQI
jgi:hypothetical protein